MISPRRPVLRLPVFAGATATAFSLGAIAVLGIAAAAAHASDWPSLRGDAQRSGVSSETIKTPLSLLWRFTGAPQSNDSNAPVVAGDTAYFAARGQSEGGGVLFAVDAKTGARKWAFPNDNTGLPNRTLFVSTPYVSGDLVYIGATDGGMYIIDANTGQEVRRFRTGGAITSSPAIVDGILYFGSNDRRFYALNPETGATAWRNIYRTEDAVNSAPVFGDTMLFFTTSDQYVHAIKQATGAFRWKARIPFRFLPNSIVYADNTLYVPSGQRLHAIQPTSGNFRWQRDVPTNIEVAPVAEGGVVYVATLGKQMYAIRSNNGKDAWAKPATLPYPAAAAPTISGNVIFVPTTRNVLVALSRTDGHVLWQYYVEPSANRAGGIATNTSLSAPLAISNGTVFSLTDDGSLSAFRADAPDQTGPIVSELYPRAGSTVSGQAPFTLAAKAMDAGSGLDVSSVAVTMDDKPIAATFDPARNLFLYQTKPSGKIVDAPIANGRHTAKVTVKDWRGNVREETWSFIVDNSLRPVTRSTNTAPPGIGGGPGGRP